MPALIVGCGSPSPAATPTPTVSPVITTEGQTSGKNKVQFTEETCKFNNMPPNGMIQCGIIVVPEDRTNPEGKKIKLHVAIVKSSAANKKTDPVLLLGGTTAILQYAGFIANGFSGILSQRDVVIMDQRGVGYSEPNLDCPELTDLFFSSFDLAPYAKLMVDKSHDAMVNCHDRLVKAGSNLAGYTSQASAADFEDLRQALGYPQWNIYGIGYGARLAQILMQSNPQTVRSVIMDSPVPAGTSIFSGEAVYAGQTLDWLFQSCAADDKCHAAFPDLKKVFYDDIAQLNQSPVEVKVHDLQNDKDYTVTVDGMRLIEQTLGVLSQDAPNTLPLLPCMIYQVNSGKFDDQLANTLSTIAYNEPTSIGLQMVIYCREDALTPTQLSQSNSGAEPALVAYFNKVDALNADACRVWTPIHAAAERAATGSISSSIPTLIEQGNLSYNTPSAWGKQIAKGMVIAYYVEFSGAGAPVSFSQNWSTCSSTINAAFLDKPTVHPDTTCASAKVTPEWVTFK